MLLNKDKILNTKNEKEKHKTIYLITTERETLLTVL